MNPVVPQRGFSVETPGSFINVRMLGPTPSHAGVIGLESSLAIRSLKISPDAFNVQQSLRTTNKSLEAYGCHKTEKPVPLTPGLAASYQESSSPGPAQIF